MTKAERTKMEKRVYAAIPWLTSGALQDQRQIMDACAREVDRAVRAERKAQRNTEELWASQRRRAEERFIERAKGLGRK